MEKRKKYQKPEIEKVALTPDEAVLTFCKGDVGTNRSGGKCVSDASCRNKAIGS